MRKILYREPNSICMTCGKAYFTQPCWKRHKNSFCSKKCEQTLTGIGKVVECERCGREVYRKISKLKRNKHFYCSNECYSMTNRKLTPYAKTILANRSYRRWRSNLLNGASCILCESKERLELHHIEQRSDNPNLLQDESNVVPMCANCHDIFHSKRSKGGELRETLNAILAHGNPQPSRENVFNFVSRKVQRLTGKESQTNKPDTSATPERDEIVRAYGKL